MYEIDELAGIVPLAVEAEQIALTEDIRVNGQREPAVLWRGKIVDGRCRQIACKELGRELNVLHLSEDLGKEAVRMIVKSLNTRRNLTGTQKAISAHYEYVRGRGTLDEVSKAWAVSRRTLANANYVAKHRPDLVSVLFEGDSVRLFSVTKGVEIVTNKVNTVAKVVRDNLDSGVVLDSSFEERIKYSVEELPMSSALYAWYGARYGEYKGLTVEGKEMMFKAVLTELARYKEAADV